MDRTDVTPDPDNLLETALTDPDSFDAARTTRLVAQLEHDDAEVQRAASWALRFVATETPSLVESCSGRFRRALRNPAARPTVLRTLTVLAEQNQEAVAEIIDRAVEADIIDAFVGQQVVAGYRPPSLESDGAVVTDEGEETTAPTETAVGEAGADLGDTEATEDSSPTLGHPPADPPTKPPRLDRSLTEYESDTPASQQHPPAIRSLQFTVRGREFTATRSRAPTASSVDEAAFRNAVERWSRIDDHDAVARVVDYGTRPVSWVLSEQGAAGKLVDRDTPVSPMEARWILSQVASAVHYAHAAGVLHRGLWPGTITLVTVVEDSDAWAFPRVADWGLWDVFRPDTDLFGVPRHYAAPEHLAPDRFGAVDAATDIYGLGVIGYELLTGSAPVREEFAVRPATDVSNRVPSELSTVLTKALNTSKMERYASAAAFKRDLTQADSDV